MSAIRSIVAATVTVALAACAASETTAPSLDQSFLARGSGAGTTAAGATALVKCELRTGSGARSTISVDGKNLRPLNAQWSARVASGANTAAAGLARAVGDEVEFDFSSQPNDIAAGAVAISRTFISVNASAADVTASIMDAAGNVVATGSADCRTR